MTYRSATLVAIVGGAMMALGSFLPWASVSSGLGTISLPGTDGDGVFSLGAGVIVALIALVHLDRPAGGSTRGLIILGGLIGLGIAVVDGGGINERIGALESGVRATVGAGIYVLGVGSVAAIIGGFRMQSYPPVRTGFTSGDFDWAQEDAKLKGP